jgi:hypothetical protein
MATARTAPPNRKSGNVLELLVSSYPALFTVDEIKRELGIGLDVDDALHWLVRMGLAHKLRRFYFATRTAIAMDDIAL